MIHSSLLSNVQPYYGAIHHLKRHIAIETRGRIRQLDLMMIDDRLIISGETDTYFIKQLANTIVMNASFDMEFDNQIEVVNSSKFRSPLPV